MKRLLFIALLVVFGCEDKEQEKIYGCTDPTACNFNSDATIFDNTCMYDIYLCDGWNYDEEIVGSWVVTEYTIGDSSFIYCNCCIYDMSINWNFLKNGFISYEVANCWYPDGTGESNIGEWLTKSNKINLYFEPAIYTTMNPDEDGYYDEIQDTIYSFNNSIFQYTTIGTALFLTAGDTTLTFESNE